MSCTKKGITKFLSLVPVVVSATPSVTSQQYMLLLKHILCNGPVCMNGTYPTTANVAFATGTPVLVGNNTYSVPVTVTGTINYLPYNPRCCCQCPKSEPFAITVNVPVYSTTGAPTPTVAASTMAASPINNNNCCLTSDQMLLQTTIAITSTVPA